MLLLSLEIRDFLEFGRDSSYFILWFNVIYLYCLCEEILYIIYMKFMEIKNFNIKYFLVIM